MNDLRVKLFIATIVLCLFGGLLGYMAGPWLSRMNYVVRVAERVWAEESQGLSERTFESDAVRLLGVPKDQLYADAREMRDTFRFGGLLFGLWCGLVIGLKIASVARESGRIEYEADRAHCLACGRCYDSCPVEHERLKGRVV